MFHLPAPLASASLVKPESNDVASRGGLPSAKRSNRLPLVAFRGLSTITSLAVILSCSESIPNPNEEVPQEGTGGSNQETNRGQSPISTENTGGGPASAAPTGGANAGGATSESTGGAATGGDASGGGAGVTEPELRIDGTKIIAPDGEAFVPVGANIAGFNYHDWAHDAVAQVDSFVDVWRFNTARANVHIFPAAWEGNVTAPYDYRTDGEAMYAALDALVDAYTSRGAVVILEVHDFTCSYPDDEELVLVAEFWRQTALRYRDNSAVWFNLLNEPQWDNLPANRRWVDVHKTLINTIRIDADADNIIVLDGVHCGQEARSWDDSPINEAESAILSFGQELIDFTGANANLLFSFHAYDQWGLGEQSFSNKMADYVDRVHAKELALMCGEVGATAPDSNLGGSATRNVYENALLRADVGMLAWHFDPKDGFRLTDGSGAYRGIDVNDTEAPTNLSTWMGHYFWAATHADHYGIQPPLAPLP